MLKRDWAISSALIAAVTGMDQSIDSLSELTFFSSLGLVDEYLHNYGSKGYDILYLE